MDIGTASQHSFTVLCNECAAEGIWRMTMATDAAGDIRPGQFMNLTVPGDGSHILKVPLSFKGADASAGTIELLYAVVGEGTRRLSEMAVGASSSLVGPLGCGWRLPEAEGRALLVAGGIGLPPVLAAAGMLAGAGIEFDVIAGSRTADMVLEHDIEDLKGTLDAGSRVIVCTDDGTAGRAGFVTEAMADLLSERRYAQVYTCGPNVMMAGVARLAMDAGIACQVSLERMMGCGFGACSCCNVALAEGGYALCCQDGPVFDAREVAW